MPPVQPNGDPASARGLIYVVEDEPELREILQEALGHLGYRIRTVGDGAGLIGLVHERRPDLILMDIGLPDMSGWDLQRTLQKDVAAAGVPVIALTGYGGGRLEETALTTLRFADYLRKPYSLAELMARIDTILGKRIEQPRV